MLANDYRPSRLEDVVGQTNAVATVQRYKSRGALSGHAWWVSGASGTGKSTIAAIIAEEVAGRYGTDEMDATDITPLDVRMLENRHRLRGPIGGKGGWAVIVNEAQGLRKDTIKQLLVTLERIPSHVVWCFTTIDDGDNLFGMDTKGHPLLSRCVPLELTKGEPTVLEFALRAREIAQKEGLDGQSLDSYISLIREHRCNLRSAIRDIEAGRMAVGT